MQVICRVWHPATVIIKKHREAIGMTDFKPAREIKKKTFKYVLDNFDTKKLEGLFESEYVKMFAN